MVLEVGSGFTKVGFAGENQPEYRFGTVFTKSKML